MSLYHSIETLLTKLGSPAALTGPEDGQQVQITALIQNDSSGKNALEPSRFVLRGRAPEHRYILLGTPDIPFSLEQGAKVEQNGRFFQLTAHQYFYHNGRRIYLYAILDEEVAEP